MGLTARPYSSIPTKSPSGGSAAARGGRHNFGHRSGRRMRASALWRKVPMRRIAPASAVVSAVLLLAAGAAHAADQGSNVEKCSRKLGVMAVAEPHGGWGYLSTYQLGSAEQLLRMMVQQSGCFDVVGRAIAMQNIQQERSLAEGGELRGESNVGKGQMQAADFVMTPAVQIAANNTGGVCGARAGGLL